MPLIHYTREDGTKFDHLQKVGDNDLESCPKTGQPVKRDWTSGKSTIFQFRVGGFHTTDYDGENFS